MVSSPQCDASLTRWCAYGVVMVVSNVSDVPTWPGRPGSAAPRSHLLR